MRSFSFFKKKEAPAAETPSARLERTTARIMDSLATMTFDPKSGLEKLRVEKTITDNANEYALKVIGITSNNEVGLGLAHLTPIAAQLNRELALDARPFQVRVEKIYADLGFGEDLATEAASYVLMIAELPLPDTESGTNVIRPQFSQ